MLFSFARFAGQLFLALFVFLLCSGLSTASAREEPEMAKVYALVSALEKRIALLEQENKKYKAQAIKTSAEKSAEVPKNFPTRTNDSFASLPKEKGFAFGSDGRNEVDLWSGLYLGASFGAATARSSVSSRDTYTSNFPGNASPLDVTGFSTFGNASGAANWGAATDLYLGFNTHFGSNVIGGLQLEGTLSEIDFSSSGVRQYTYFDGNGPTGQTATSDFRPRVHSRWMTSALARVGVIPLPDTMIYAIGGVSLAHFDYQNLTDTLFYQPKDSFYAIGWNVGGGIEKSLNSNWSLRAEYRYTNFGSVTVENQFGFNSSIPSSQAHSIKTRFENDMHMMRLGVAYRPNI